MKGITWVWLVIGIAGWAAADRPDYLLRVHRQTEADLVRLLDGGFVVVAEWNRSLLILGDDSDVSALEASGRGVEIVDQRPRSSAYVRIGFWETTDWTAVQETGTVLFIEDRHALLRLAPGGAMDKLEQARVFVSPERLQKLKHPKADNKGSDVPTRGLRHVVPLVQQMVNSVNTSDIDSYWTTLATNAPYGTRYSTSTGCQNASTYCNGVFTGLGLSAQNQSHTAGHAPNVIATHPGAVNPDDVYIVIGHLDDMPSSGSAPGADDNASGSVHVLEAAKVLSCYAFKNTIKFIVVTGEEFGLYGSEYYAAQAVTQGENILGVVNMDMPGWEGTGSPEDLDLIYRSSDSTWLKDLYTQCASDYVGLPIKALNCPSMSQSDHYPFWLSGFPAVFGITSDHNLCGGGGPDYPYYHQSTDTIWNCGNQSNNHAFFYSTVKATIATLAELGDPFKIAFDRASYACVGTLQIIVGDRNLNTNPSTTQTVQVQVWSTTEAAPETVTLTEDGVNSMLFKGPFPLTGAPPANGDGQLSVSAGDTISGRYTDALDCNGSTNVQYTATAGTDCTPPVISNVQITAISDSTAVITWTTNEAANSRVTYGTSTPPGTNRDDLLTYDTSHSLQLTGLTGCTDYYFSVTSADVAGNGTTDTNGGAYYHFKTYGRSYLFGPDDVESGQGAWTVSGTGGTSAWHIDTCKRHSETRAWKAGVAACPGTYGNGLDTYLTSGALNPGAAGHGWRLRFWEYYATETPDAGCGYDPLRTQASSDGTNFTTLATNCTSSNGWVLKDYDLAAFTGSAARIRFWMYTDSSGGGEGWYVDDLEVSKAVACGPELRHQSHVITDDCAGGGAGDGDGVPDAGETGLIRVTALNTGSLPATAVTTALSTTTPGVTISDGSAAFPDIAAGAVGTSIAPHFSVGVDPDVACGTVINFTLQFTAAEGTWADAFSVTVGTVTPGITTPVNENFAAGNPPTGWTRVNGGTGTQQWTTTNPGGRATPAGMAAPFEIIDSDFDGSGYTQDDHLITPAFDTTGATKVELIFDTYYYHYTGSYADVDVSTNNGGSWTNFSHWTATVGSGSTASHQVMNITTPAGSNSQVKVRFRYVGTWGYYWLVDNVQVVVTRAPTCSQTVCPASGPNVQYDGSYDPIASLVQTCGDGDGVVEAGEDWRVTVRLKNVGTAQASGTVASLAVNPGSAVAATIQSGNPGAYGTIASGGGTATADFVFRVAQGAACGNDITFDMTGISSAEKSYPGQSPAFTVPVGLISAGGNETKIQQTTPLNATSAAADSDLGATGFTLAAADTATLSYSSNFAPQTTTFTLFSDEFTTDPAGNGWTETGNVTNPIAAPTDTCIGGGTNYAFIPGAGAAPGNSIRRGVDTTGRTTIQLVMDYRYAGMDSGEGIFVDYSTTGVNGTYTNIWSKTSTGANQDMLWGDDCARTIAFPASCENNANFAIRIRDSAGSPAESVWVDHLKITGQGSSGGTWTANARVSLVDPANTVTVLKAYGAGDGSPYDVRPYYTGLGMYKLRLEENAGGIATVTGGSMNIVMNPANECDVSGCGSAAPPPVKDSGSGAARFSKGAGSTLNVTYDNTTCSAQKVIILYNTIGTWTGYAGCAQSDGGNGGSTTVNSAGQTSTWYNLVWAQGTTAGHPGFPTTGDRNWNANGFCGMTADNQTKNTCP